MVFMYDATRFNGFIKNELDDLLFRDIWDFGFLTSATFTAQRISTSARTLTSRIETKFS